MLESFRRFLDTGTGKGVAIAVVLIGVVAAGWSLRGVTTSEGEELASKRVYINAKTNEVLYLTFDLKTKVPMDAYPAEACYWTKDGKPKKEPTYVLLNTYKGSSDPTFCPDCERLVVGHNPAPGPNVQVPPTKAEYKPGRRNTERE